MAATGVTAVITSEMADIHDLPFDVDLSIGVGDYERIMRRIRASDGASGTPVSAFNSSI